MELVNIENVRTQPGQPAGFFKSFLAVCTTFGSNVVERFHEYADARLAEELTIVEQRKRLLADRAEQAPMVHQAVLAHRTGQFE